MSIQKAMNCYKKNVITHFRQLKKTVMLEYPIIKGYSSILYSFGL